MEDFAVLSLVDLEAIIPEGTKGSGDSGKKQEKL